MSGNNYKRLEEDLNQVRSSEVNMPKGSTPDFEHGRTPPPPYEVDFKPQPYGMVSSPINPTMVGMIPEQGAPGSAIPMASTTQQTSVFHIVPQQQIMGPTSVGQNPIRIQCPSCRAFIKSRVERTCISKTHLWACCLFLCLCWPCMCIPYCSKSCRDANHSCPNCKAFLGTYKA